MNVTKLAKHEYPARPQHDVRGMSVLDSRDRIVGAVADLYVDEGERHLRFLDVATEGFMGLGKQHYLVPFEAMILSADASRRGYYGAIGLQVDRETVQRSPTFANPLTGPDPEFQKTILQHYGYG